MSSTNKTTNYELSQFVETDRPAWLTDYNGDMRTIDSTMKAISDVASGASGSISELADRMSTAEGNISINTNDIATLDARADALEAGAQSQAGTIANIQTEQITQNAGIEAATELGYNLARPYDSASTYAVGDYVLFQNTLYKCTTAIATGEAFDPSKWLAIKATDEIAAGGYTLPTASASTLGGVKVGSGLSIDAVTGVLSASGGSSEFLFNSFETNTEANPTLSVQSLSYIEFDATNVNGTTTDWTSAITSQNVKCKYVILDKLLIMFLDCDISASSTLTVNSNKNYTFLTQFNVQSTGDHYSLFNRINNFVAATPSIHAYNSSGGIMRATSGSHATYNSNPKSFSFNNTTKLMQASGGTINGFRPRGTFIFTLT